MAPRALALVVLVLLFGYGVFKAWPLLSGPSLTIESPAPFVTTLDGYLLIQGVAKHTESLIINGGQVYTDQEGRFRQLLLMPAGGAILTLTATDRFGRSITKRRSVFIP